MLKLKVRPFSKSHAHRQTMTKTPVQFQKTLGGVMDTRYILSEGAESRLPCPLTFL